MEKALQLKPQSINLVSTLALKALCQHRLNRPADARATFDEAERVVKPLLPEPLSETEGFLDESKAHLSYLLLRREAQAALAAGPPGQ